MLKGDKNYTSSDEYLRDLIDLEPPVEMRTWHFFAFLGGMCAVLWIGNIITIQSTTESGWPFVIALIWDVASIYCIIHFGRKFFKPKKSREAKREANIFKMKSAIDRASNDSLFQDVDKAFAELVIENKLSFGEIGKIGVLRRACGTGGRYNGKEQFYAEKINSYRAQIYGFPETFGLLIKESKDAEAGSSQKRKWHFDEEIIRQCDFKYLMSRISVLKEIRTDGVTIEMVEEADKAYKKISNSGNNQQLYSARKQYVNEVYIEFLIGYLAANYLVTERSKVCVSTAHSEGGHSFSIDDSDFEGDADFEDSDIYGPDCGDEYEYNFDRDNFEYDRGIFDYDSDGLEDWK